MLNGTYVFDISVVGGTPFAAFGGQFTADGQGKITGGVFTSTTVESPTAISGAPLTGSYKMTSDGRGQVSLSTSSTTIALDLVLTSKNHGYVMEFDNNGLGSGTLDLQSTVSQGDLVGSYVVSLSGEDGTKNHNPMVIAGSFTLDASGNITGGVLDSVISAAFTFGTTLAQPLSGDSLLLGSGNSPGKAGFQTTFLGTVPMPFDVYPVDATHLKLIGTSQVFLGEAFRQGTALPSGPQVFTLAGAGQYVGGLMTFDGNGNVTAGLEDLNDSGGTYLSMPFSGSYSLLDSNGRATATLTGFSPNIPSIGTNPTTQFVLYPSTGGLVILEIDAITDMMGPAFVQTNPSLPTGKPFGMFLFGYTSDQFSNTAQFTTGSSGTSLSGLIDANSFAISGTSNIWTQTSGQTLTGTYSLDSTTGRGSLSSNSSIDLEFYLIDDTSALLFGNSGTQQANSLGSFAAQNLSATKSSMFTPPRFSFARNPAGRLVRVPHRE
jgi:hypothetical protein